MTARSLLSLSLLLLAACSKTPRPEPGASPAGSTTTKPPRIKEHKATPNEKVGTLPEGIGLSVGSKVPDVQVQDSDGRSVSLSSLLSKGSLLVVFYRGGWCPFCNYEIRSLSKAAPEFVSRGVTPVAVSVDLPEKAATTRATYTIPFPVLSDPELAMHRVFRVEKKVSDTEVLAMKGFDIDLEAASGQKHHVIAIPSLFLLDQEGKVRWAHADPDYKVRPTIPQILAAIDGVKLKTSPEAAPSASGR
jgi:peroxiredoxin